MLLEIREWANNYYAPGSTGFRKVTKKHRDPIIRWQRADFLSRLYVFHLSAEVNKSGANNVLMLITIHSSRIYNEC